MQFLKINKPLFVRLGKARSHKYIMRKPDGKGGWIYIYNKKDKENYEHVNYKDMQEFGYEKAVEISKDTEKIRNSNVEISKIYNYHGDGIFEKTGSKEGMDFSDAEKEKIRNSRLLIHNHPSADSFSTKDLHIILDLDIREIRAFGMKKMRSSGFSLKIKKKIPQELRQGILNSHLFGVRYFKSQEISWPADKAMLEIAGRYEEYFEYDKPK